MRNTFDGAHKGARGYAGATGLNGNSMTTSAPAQVAVVEQFLDGRVVLVHAVLLHHRHPGRPEHGQRHEEDAVPGAWSEIGGLRGTGGREGK